LAGGNSETEFTNGKFVPTSINLKNESAGDGRGDKTVKKTTLRTFCARTFLHAAKVKRRKTLAEHMFSASAPTTEMRWLHRHDRFVPKSDIGQLFDHLVGPSEERRRHRKTNRSGGFEVDRSRRSSVPATAYRRAPRATSISETHSDAVQGLQGVDYAVHP